MKKRILLLIPLLILTSCSKGYIRYGVKKPYIEIESSNQQTGELKDNLPSIINLKISNNDTFILYIHSTYCTHCIESEKEFLNPYLQEHNKIIYGINLANIIGNDVERNYFNEITKKENHKYKNFEGTPFYAIYQNGIYINGEQDYKYFSLFFNTYII